MRGTSIWYCSQFCHFPLYRFLRVLSSLINTASPESPEDFEKLIVAIMAAARPLLNSCIESPAQSLSIAHQSRTTVAEIPAQSCHKATNPFWEAIAEDQVLFPQENLMDYQQRPMMRTRTVCCKSRAQLRKVNSYMEEQNEFRIREVSERARVIQQLERSNRGLKRKLEASEKDMRMKTSEIRTERHSFKQKIAKLEASLRDIKEQARIEVDHAKAREMRARTTSQTLQRNLQTIEQRMICAICCTDQSDRLLPCGHMFCQSCLKRWEQERNVCKRDRICHITCPSCRTKLRVKDQLNLFWS